MADAPERERPRILDVGAGDPEAPANAIPNIIAHLVETETWRNSATVLTACLLIGLGYWAYHGVRDAIADTQATGLQALLGTVASGLDVWVNEQRTQTERLAKQPLVEEPAGRLASAVAASRDPEDAVKLCQSPDSVELASELSAFARARGAAGVKVVDRTGLVLAAANPANCGRRLRSPLFRVKLDRALEGTPQFVRPHQDLELSLPGSDGRRRPVAWVVVPIRNGKGGAGVALALGAVADGDFAGVFSAARPGSTTEAYAFGDDGLMLTPTRFAETLTAAGMLPSESSSGTFAVPVRDPGGDLEAGHAPALEPGARPLTQSAAHASAARDKAHDVDRQGVLVTPYRSYRGDEVIGAWRWLPAYDIGLIAEISAKEAFAPLRYLLISFALIGTFVVISLAAALTSGFSLSRLQRQFGRLQVLGAYTLQQKISEGGMATIYLAHHALLKRPTAVKVLKKHVATDEFVHRFEREVQLASQLLHPNTVRIYDFGRTRDGLPYYVMEYLDGVTLAELVEQAGPVPPGRVIHILRQVGAALREAHEHGMIHRDVKPENVMLCRRGEDDVVKLLDFGLVKNLETTRNTRDVTKQVDLLGTPRYMAPERLLSPAGADPRSDIYALGAVGYYLLTGKPIFDGEDNMEIGNQVLHTPAPRASESATVPAGLDDLIAACLEKDRARRPQTMSVLIDALDRLASRLAWTQDDASAWWASHRERAALDAGANVSPLSRRSAPR